MKAIGIDFNEINREILLPCSNAILAKHGVLVDEDSQQCLAAILLPLYLRGYSDGFGVEYPPKTERDKKILNQLFECGQEAQKEWLS